MTALPHFPYLRDSETSLERSGRLLEEPAVRALLADYHVLSRYSAMRAGRYGDMSRARREREVNRLADELIDAGIELDRDTYDLPEVAPAELADAFERVGRPRLERLERETRPLVIDFDGRPHKFTRRTRYNGTSLATWRELEQQIATR